MFRYQKKSQGGLDLANTAENAFWQASIEGWHYPMDYRFHISTDQYVSNVQMAFWSIGSWEEVRFQLPDGLHSYNLMCWRLNKKYFELETYTNLMMQLCSQIFSSGTPNCVVSFFKKVMSLLPLRKFSVTIEINARTFICVLSFRAPVAKHPDLFFLATRLQTGIIRLG